MTSIGRAQLTAVSALVLAVVGIALLLFTGGSDYTIHARFYNAGGLVPGGLVEIAGRAVGTVGDINLSPDGEADVELSISDNSVTPLHEDTRAAIRAVGQAGITNNFVVLSPGPPSTPSIPDGGLLPVAQTPGIVPIDALLDAFGPAQRASLDHLISDSSQVYAGSGARYFNEMLGHLDPALAQIDGFTGSLALDRGALAELVRSADQAASALAARPTDLTDAVTHTATVLSAVASQRAALADLLTRLPSVLAQGRATLGRTAGALTELRPALREIGPVAGPLAAYLEEVHTALPVATPVLAQLVHQLPALNKSLSGLVGLERPAVDALDSLGPVMRGLGPILHGVRLYGVDLVLGVLGGVLGVATSEYDGYGHYVKANFVQSPQTLLAGPLSAILSAHPLVPGLLATRTGLTRRCPGGSEPPAPDGSSPWDVGSALCTPADDIPLSVDFP